jgi:hypothetical protein
VDPRVGLDDVEKRTFLTLQALELQPLGRPVRNQSLYRLSYPGSSLYSLCCMKIVELSGVTTTLWAERLSNRGSIPSSGISLRYSFCHPTSLVSEGNRMLVNLGKAAGPRPFSAKFKNTLSCSSTSPYYFMAY